MLYNVDRVSRLVIALLTSRLLLIESDPMIIWNRARALLSIISNRL